MPAKIPPIKVIAKIDPRLASMVSAMNRMKRVPLNNLKKAALEYGKVSQAKTRPMMMIMHPATIKLMAAAAGFYVWQSRKRS